MSIFMFPVTSIQSAKMDDDNGEGSGSVLKWMRKIDSVLILSIDLILFVLRFYSPVNPMGSC